ncbi:MAG TPA: hypothetical protein VFH23_05165 [Jiangellaceae bacterium]|nr:hypothetical protein [Jiangellaceae bacterium]
MNDLIHAALLQLGTTRLLVLGGLAIAALLGTATATTAEEEASAALGSTESMANIVGVSAMPGFFMLILGVLATAASTSTAPSPRRSSASRYGAGSSPPSWPPSPLPASQRQPP